ncbi:F-box protein PP2-B11-like [Phragmites australis]|uniref:F-box protein PP2-B11-like n=1 Tax=Phragmites australis TaxID=29695 RepID=UPI002D793913|nr:F-box protein PP2-B11-like [Phragmites australis]
MERKGADESMGTTASVSACEIACLPKDVLSEAISLTAPRDAFRAAAVSSAFRAAADSDAVWACFLPADLPPLSDGELSPVPLSKKALFMRLSERPVLLAGGLTSMWLNRETGAKCYMLSARALCITWGDTPQYWRWIPLTDSRFSEAAKLRAVCWLEIRGKIDSKMLSQNSTYAAYIVFKIDDKHYGLDSPVQEATVSIGENKSNRQVCLEGYDNKDDDEDEVPQNHRPMMSGMRRLLRRNRRVRPPAACVQLPQERSDGWMELEMGEFYNEEGDDGEVSVSLMETRGGNWKKGLIVYGIEIRVKK